VGTFRQLDQMAPVDNRHSWNLFILGGATDSEMDLGEHRLCNYLR
jgi:hypothetical protein